MRRGKIRKIKNRKKRDEEEEFEKKEDLKEEWHEEQAQTGRGERRCRRKTGGRQYEASSGTTTRLVLLPLPSRPVCGVQSFMTRAVVASGLLLTSAFPYFCSTSAACECGRPSMYARASLYFPQSSTKTSRYLRMFRQGNESRGDGRGAANKR